MPPRKKPTHWDKISRRQVLGTYRPPDPSPRGAEPGPPPRDGARELINPNEWALVVCISVDGKAEVHGRRTRKAGKALRMVAAATEAWEEQ